jgi:hypothetical protein
MCFCDSPFDVVKSSGRQAALIAMGGAMDARYRGSNQHDL